MSVVAGKWDRSQVFPTLNNLVSHIKYRHVHLIIEGFRFNRRFVLRAELRARGREATILVRPLDDLQRIHKLAENCRCQQWAITPEEGQRLVMKVLEDVGKVFTYSIHQNNCIKWCIDTLNQLQLENIRIEEQWYNFAVVLPRDVL